MAEFIEVLSQKSKEDIDKLIKQLGLVAAEVNTINKAFKDVKLPSTASKQINETRKATAGLNAEQKEAKRLSQALERERAKLTFSTSKQAEEVQRLRFENAETNKRTKEAAIISSKLSSEYQKQQIKLTQLIRVQQDLMLKQELGNKLSEREARLLKLTTAEINRKDAALKRTDESAGKFQRSVGNYRNALGGALGMVRSMTSALGLMGGAFLAVSIFRDLFQRIRDFDKSMQNLAGILGETRAELRTLETDIINVAGASVKTSNEVADLATSLIALGKTKDEVSLLLGPVNNLGIALQTTGAEAGELLVQTLNAFNKSASSGQEFADIIAKVRTSTALDFTRIKDALGFLAPTANVLGLSFERTAAILGTLNDNSIKAARAGRLMSSSFARLNEKGLTLDDALTQINGSTDRLGTATELFGVESFTLGIILADNIDKTNKYTEAFEKAGGALDSLVKEQLKALDAEIAILNSNYESFILNLDNGNGIISRTTRGLIAMASSVIEVLDALTLTEQDERFKRFDEILEDREERYRGLGDAAKDFAKIEQQIAIQANLDLIRDSTRITNELNKLKESAKFDLLPPIGAEALQKELDEINMSFVENKAIIEATTNVLLGNVKANVDTVASLEKLLFELRVQQKETATTSDAYAKFGEEIKVVEDKIKALKGTLGGVNAVLEGTVKFFEDIINKLEAQQRETATTRGEWLKYQEQIDKAKESLRLLTRELLGMEDQTTVNQIETRGITDIESDDSFAATNIGLEKFNQLTKEGQEKTEKLMELLDKLANKDLLFDQLEGLGNLLNIDTSVLESSFDVLSDKNAEMNDKIKAGAEAGAAILSGIGRTLAQDQIIRINNQIAENDRLYNNLIQQAEGDAVAQQLLREDQQVARRKLESERLKEERKAALFQIALSTAVAIVKALPNVPLSIAVAAIGAAQAAIVASRPIPEYKKGRKGGEDEYAILGDGYKEEAILGKDGNLKGISPNKPTMMHLDKGDSVIPSLNHSIARSAVLDSITMNANKMSPASDTQNQINAMRNENSRLKKDIIGSLRSAKFVNRNSTTFDMGHQFKLLKYKGK